MNKTMYNILTPIVAIILTFLAAIVTKQGIELGIGISRNIGFNLLENKMSCL